MPTSLLMQKALDERKALRKESLKDRERRIAAAVRDVLELGMSCRDAAKIRGVGMDAVRLAVKVKRGGA